MTRWTLFAGLAASLQGFGQSAPAAGAPPKDTLSSEVRLNEVLVVPRPAGHTVHEVRLNPVMPVQHAPEAFEAYLSSLDVRSRGLNDVQSDLSVRGSTFDQVHVVVDGIPYSDPQTGHHSATLPVPVEAIEAVSVLPSGGSYRYGPFAFAGVLELTTIDAQSGRGYASASAGAFGYTRAAGGVPLRRTKLFASRLDVSYAAADGAFTNSDFATWQAYLKAQRHLGTEGEWGLLRAQLGYSVKMFGAQGFYSFAYPTQFEHLRSLNASLNYRLRRLQANVFVRQLEDRYELFRQHPNYYMPYVQGRWIHVTDSTVTPSWYTGANVHRNRSYGGEVVVNSPNGPTRVLSGFAGLDARHDEVASSVLGELQTDTLVTNWGRYAHFDARRNAGIFGSLRYAGAARTLVQADLRLNVNDRYGLDWLPNLGVEHRVLDRNEDHVTALASVNRSFRLPTFTDLYYRLGGAQGSANLQPEYAWNTKAGLVWTQSGGRGARLTAYERRGTNLIDWIYRSIDGNQVLQADNVTAVRIRGLELEAHARLHGTWSARAQFAGHRASDVNGQSIYALDYLARRVQLSWNSELRASGALLPIQCGLVVVGQDRAGNYVLPDGSVTAYRPFATVDVRASYRLGELLLFADAMNLLDQTVVDFGNVPLPGRWVKLGLRLEWD
ncbi:MAG: TonB-dependent receptor [Schleiferiaceae bacterium]